MESCTTNLLKDNKTTDYKLQEITCLLMREHKFKLKPKKHSVTLEEFVGDIPRSANSNYLIYQYFHVRNKVDCKSLKSWVLLNLFHVP